MTFTLHLSFLIAARRALWLSVMLLMGIAQAAPTREVIAPEQDSGLTLSLGFNEPGIRAQLDDFRDAVSTKTSELVLTAMGFLGVPYKRGGNTETSGFDCSGFVRATYERTLGLVLPRRASEQAHATTPIPKEELRPGDLVFFNTMRRTFSHVGIYLGNGQFIHAPRAGAKVRVEDMRQAYWSKRFNGARRVEGSAPMDAGQATQLLAPTPQ